MLLLGDAIEIISNIYTLTSDVSKNGSILIDVPNVTSFYCGFKYHIDGSGGRLVTKIGDISNNIIIDISHNELLDSNLVIKYNDIIVKDVSLNSMFYDISDVPLDIKLLDGLLNVIINNIDISTNILVSEYQNNTFTIQGITDSSQNTIHLIKDIFFDPINVLEDDIFLKRGIYANRYFNVNYDDILNKPWMNIGFDDVYFGGGNVGIGTYVPLSGLDLWGNASIKGNLDISGHILPALNEVYDLGSNDYRWRDIYLSGNTIDLNGTKLSKHTNGNLMVHDTSGTMLGVTMDHIDLSGTIIRRHTDGSVVLDNGSGERVTGRFGDLDVSGNANVSGNISGVNITGTQLISNIASGTAPLTVTSTTLVTNLNADLLDGLDNTKFMRTDTNTSSTGTISSSSTITGTRLISNIASGTAPLTVTSTTIVKNLNADLLEGLNPSQFMRTDTNTSSTGTLSSSSTITGTQLISNIASGTAPLTVSSSTLVTNLNADLLEGLNPSQFMRTDTNTSSTGTLSSSSTITGTQLISNIASGTAPLTVTSTTLVTNLNADLLDGLDNTKFMRTDTNTSSTGTISSSSTITGTRLISNIASGTAPLTVTSTTIVTNLNADLLDNLDSTHYLNYNNLTNKPTIPAAQVNADWNAASGVAQILNKPTISTFNGGTITNRLTINYGDPTINFQDTDNDSAFLHCNSNILYVLRGGTNATTWTQVNGQWPWEFNLSNNNSKCGGSLNVIGGITSGAITAARVIPYSTSNNSSYYTAAIEVRELNQGGAQSGGWGEAPRIGFHWGGRVASQILMDTAGTITIVNNPGNAYEAFRAGTTFAHGTLYAYAGAVINMTSIGTFNTDFVGISGTTGNGGNYNLQLYILYNTFTGFHRSFTDDLLYNDEDPDIFKKTYMGRLVIASGEIATDTIVDKEKNEWTILRNKEGISVEDAVPIVQLTRQRKDKRVFGVLGLAERNNSRNERLIVNSVGEGAIWVVNTNGNIENGDYIQSSPELGYGERQDDDILHNYTAAKATIDCSFILDSPKYNCITLPNGLKAAFIACTYHCG